MAKPLSILVVDDNPINRMVAVEFVRILGHEAHEAVDGLDAIAKWEAHSPALILMDLNMPHMNGLLATLRIRELERAQQRPKTWIYMWTASAHITEAEKRRAGADDSMPKPVHLDAFQAALARASNHPM